jgi:hypothetical protein
MMAIEPESIWLAKGEGYAAPRAEVETLLSKWQAEDFRPLWDRATRLKTPWYLSRETGLRTWASHAARQRIKVYWREAYTLKDFRQFRLAESWQRNPSAIDDELASDMAAHMMETDSAAFFRWAGNVRRLKAVSLNPMQGLYCCLFDRAEIPLEYWTFPAAAAYLRFRAGQRDPLDERAGVDRLRHGQCDLAYAQPNRRSFASLVSLAGSRDSIQQQRARMDCRRRNAGPQAPRREVFHQCDNTCAESVTPGWLRACLDSTCTH